MTPTEQSTIGPELQSPSISPQVLAPCCTLIGLDHCFTLFVWVLPEMNRPPYVTQFENKDFGTHQVASGLCQGNASESFGKTLSQPIEYQQDRMFAGVSEVDLSEQDLRDACLRTAGLTKECIDGSTASVAVLNSEGPLLVAQIGDSPVIAFAITQTGKVQGEFLIHETHNANPKIPIDPRQVPPELRDDASLSRLAQRFYNISICRALGDRLYSLSAEADIHSHSIESLWNKAGESGQVFLCVASDGICPPIKAGKPAGGDQNWVTHYAEIIQEELEKVKQAASSEMIVKWIMDETIRQRKQQDEQDNIAIQVTEISARRNQTLVLGICDGHRAADYAGLDFSGRCAQLAADSLSECLIPRNCTTEKLKS